MELDEELPALLSDRGSEQSASLSVEETQDESLGLVEVELPTVIEAEE